MKYDLYINDQVADTVDLEYYHDSDKLDRVMTAFMVLGWADVISSEDKLEVKLHVEPIVVEKRPSMLGNLFARVYLFGQGIVFSVQTMFR